jgi:hypothetical protein
MASTLLVSSKSHLLLKGRLVLAFARSAASSIGVKPSKSVSSCRYFLGLNGINASSPSKRLDDDLDIPPLDLLSVIEVAKAKEAEQSANKAATELAKKDIELPPLDLSSEQAQQSTAHTASLNLLSIVPSASETKSVVPSPSISDDRASDGIPYFAIGAYSQLSGRAKGLAEEITNLKRKLKTKKLHKSHAARLAQEIERKQRKIDELMNPGTKEISSSKKARGLVTDKNDASGADPVASHESNLLSVVPSSANKNIIIGPETPTHSPQLYGRAKGLAEEITNLKRKLKTKTINKSHAARLAQEIERKQRKIDELMNPGNTKEISASQKAQDLTREITLLEALLLNEEVTADRAARLKNEIELKRRKVDRLNKGELSKKDMKRIKEGRMKLISPRETKNYVLPLPKASSKGVLIPEFDSEVIRTQANGTVLARSGTTSILSTVILVPPEQSASDNNTKTFEQAVLDSIQKRNALNGSLFLPLQVEYRERWHASGKIPTHNQRRRDNSGPLSEREVLASRAIDRTLRPWLAKGLGDTTSEHWSGLLPENIVVNCQVQSYDTRPSTNQHRTHADPTSLAINSAIAAIYQSNSGDATQLHVPIEAAAAVKLAMRPDGDVLYDPTPSEAEECAFELLVSVCVYHCQ